MFLFVVILTFYFEIISIRSILIAWEWMINVQIKNELLRRKRMSLYNFFLFPLLVSFFLIGWMNSIISSAERWMNWTVSRPFIEQVSLFIEICISCHTFLHLTKMTFHRIVLFAKHRPFTGILSLSCWLHIEVANAFYRLTDCWKSFLLGYSWNWQNSFSFHFIPFFSRINIRIIEIRGKHGI